MCQITPIPLVIQKDSEKCLQQTVSNMLHLITSNWIQWKSCWYTRMSLYMYISTSHLIAANSYSEYSILILFSHIIARYHSRHCFIACTFLYARHVSYSYNCMPFFFLSIVDYATEVDVQLFVININSINEMSMVSVWIGYNGLTSNKAPLSTQWYRHLAFICIPQFLFKRGSKI